MGPPETIRVIRMKKGKTGKNNIIPIIAIRRSIERLTKELAPLNLFLIQPTSLLSGKVRSIN
jgi:hypothetical protein